MPETAISTAFSAGSSEESGESGIRIAQMAEAAPNGRFQHPLPPGIVRPPDDVVRAELVEVAQQNQILDLQFRAAIFNMAVSLLRFLDDLCDLLLRQVSIFPDFPKPSAIVHAASPRKYRIILEI